jgi:hypothetical protein
MPRFTVSHQRNLKYLDMKDGIRPDTKKRPLTGVRAQDLTNSANNLQLKISDMEKSPRRNVILPQLREPHKLISSK